MCKYWKEEESTLPIEERASFRDTAVSSLDLSYCIWDLSTTSLSLIYTEFSFVSASIY